MDNMYEKDDNIVLAHAIENCGPNDSWLLLASGKCKYIFNMKINMNIRPLSIIQGIYNHKYLR